MNTGALVLLLGLAACGGNVARGSSVDSGDRSDGGRPSTDAHRADSKADAALSHPDAKPADARLSDDAFTDSGFSCILRSNQSWNCGGENYISCPSEVEQQGAPCALDAADICVACTTNGTGEQWICGGTWNVGGPVTCQY